MIQIRRFVLFIALSTAAIGGFLAGRPVNAEPIADPKPNWHIGHIRCAGPAEDSLAHLILEEFRRDATGELHLRYRCARTGY